MTAVWRRDDTRLIVQQKGGWIWILRLLFGLPLLIMGTMFLWDSVSQPMHRFLEGGWPAVWGWLPSTFFSLFFAAAMGPLGWWLVMSRTLVILDPANRRVLEVKDWRLGRLATTHDLGDYRKVSVECDYLLSVKESRSAGNTLANYVRLLPRQRHAPALQVAFFPQSERTRPEELGRLAAEALGLPLVVNLDDIAQHRTEDGD
ncbi:MAG: hypothetical protein P4L99_11345 [Chthoniobacter sp.]|nr:hypothetical protein [Chthoniobacter sp.]